MKQSSAEPTSGAFCESKCQRTQKPVQQTASMHETRHVDNVNKHEMKAAVMYQQCTVGAVLWFIDRAINSLEIGE